MPLRRILLVNGDSYRHARACDLKERSRDKKGTHLLYDLTAKRGVYSTI